MLFSSKSEGALYIDNCLINPQKQPGIWSEEQFFWEAVARPTIQETEEWLGDFLAGNLQKKILADLIWQHLRDKANPKKTRDLDKSRSNLYEKILPNINQLNWAVSEFHLDKNRLGLSASKLIVRFLDLKDANTVHESEINLMPMYRLLRFRILTEVPDSWLEKIVYHEIETALGINLDFQA